MNGNTVICEARSILRVGVSSTIKLHMQSEQLGVGRKLPIYPLFPEVIVTKKMKRVLPLCISNVNIDDIFGFAREIYFLSMSYVKVTSGLLKMKRFSLIFKLSFHLITSSPSSPF